MQYGHQDTGEDMTEFEALQGRINAALDRIGTQVEQISLTPEPEPTPEPEGPDRAELMQQLEDERLANAQLEERIVALNAQVTALEEAQAQAEAEPPAPSTGADPEVVAAQAQQLARLDMELYQLRRANEQLVQSSEELRKAAETQSVDPMLINQAMLSEIDGLRRARAADKAEIETLLAQLEPLVAQATEDDDAEKAEEN